MAKLEVQREIHSTSIDGIYFREPDFKLAAELEKLKNQDDILTLIFCNLVCDQDGNQFENCTTLEDVKKLPISTLTKLQGDVESFLLNLIPQKKPVRKRSTK